MHDTVAAHPSINGLAMLYGTGVSLSTTKAINQSGTKGKMRAFASNRAGARRSASSRHRSSGQGRQSRRSSSADGQLQCSQEVINTFWIATGWYGYEASAVPAATVTARSGNGSSQRRCSRSNDHAGAQFSDPRFPLAQDIAGLDTREQM